jgi:hypothetical protein
MASQLGLYRRGEAVQIRGGCTHDATMNDANR